MDGATRGRNDVAADWQATVAELGVAAAGHEFAFTDDSLVDLQARNVI